MSPGGRTRRRFARRRMEAGLAEMLGMVRGVIADGVVSEDEAAHLADWVAANPRAARQWPANLLARRLVQVFHDGRVDARERRCLESLLEQIAANPAGLGSGFSLATDLPITRPLPEVLFEQRTFLFAGEMAYGPTRACEREVVELGAFCEPSVSRRTDYVVIGSLAASEWSQAGFGDVIDEVVDYRARGIRIAVISEEHWVASLP